MCFFYTGLNIEIMNDNFSFFKEFKGECNGWPEHFFNTVYGFQYKKRRTKKKKKNGVGREKGSK